MKSPEIPATEIVSVFNPGDPVSFQHNGVFHVLASGMSAWPYEIAQRLERKYGYVGVRIQYADVSADAERRRKPLADPVNDIALAIQAEAMKAEIHARADAEAEAAFQQIQAEIQAKKAEQISEVTQDGPQESPEPPADSDASPVEPEPPVEPKETDAE